MISVGLHIPGPHDATSWYRATGPLGHLRKMYPHTSFRFERLQEWAFGTVQMLDIAFFQRPSTKGELEAIRICKRLNVPVIVDYDDLLFDIPSDNPAHRMYMNKETQDAIISIIREATCVWVSTSELKRCLQLKEMALNEKVYVVPNALDNFGLCFGQRAEPPPANRRQAAVIWRGSPTHTRDVMEFSPEIEAVASENPKTSFVFVGWNPWFLTDRMQPQQAICSGALPVGEFMDFLYATGARIGQVPLHDSRFNKCKSNIAWLEMTWAGGVVLAPDWEEWRKPGIVSYRTADDYADGLNSLCRMDPEELAKLHTMSWEHIKNHFTLSTVNDIRMNTMLAAMGRAQWPCGYQRIEDPDDNVMELE